MEDYLGGVEVEGKDAIQGKFEYFIDNLWGMKEPNYVTRMIATSCRLLEDDTRKETVIRWRENGEDVVKKFNYKLPFDYNFRYHHDVDDHNNLRHALPSIKATWMTDRWECQ